MSSPRIDFPALRSLLFVPPTKLRYIEKAPSTAAGGFIIDLEDSIGPAMKAAARAAVPEVLDALRVAGRPVLVRINAAGEDDIKALASCEFDGVIVPKVRSAAEIEALAQRMQAATLKCSLLASIEDAQGVLNAAEIARHPKVTALMFGAGDFIAATGMAPQADILAVPAIMTILAARAAGLPAFGLPGLIAEFRDLEGLRRLATHAKSLGFCGSPAIHPDQIVVLKESFGPTAEELAVARRIVHAYESSDGSPQMNAGVFIDQAVYLNSQRKLAIC